MRLVRGTSQGIPVDCSAATAVSHPPAMAWMKITSLSGPMVSRIAASVASSSALVASSNSSSCGRVSSAANGGVHGLQDEGEDILVHRVPRAEALELLAADRIPNGHTLIALQWLQLNVEQLRERWR